MGSVFNRGTRHKPNWYVKFKDLGGVWKMLPSKKPTKAEAEQFLSRAESRVADGKVGVAPPSPEDHRKRTLTIGALVDLFLDPKDGYRGDPRRKPLKDIKTYRAQARSAFKCRILPALGHRAAASVTGEDVGRLKDDQLAAGLTAGSVAQTLAALSRLFTWAADRGLIDCRNPVAEVGRLRSAESIDFLDGTEVAQLLAYAEDHAPELPVGLFPMVATAIYCGLRKGELFGLRWSAVHLDAARIDVLHSYGGVPKDGEKRHLPMHPELVRILRAWRDACPATPQRLVFPVLGPRAGRKTGGYRMGAKEDTHGLIELLLAADCHLPTDGHPWHMLRHSFAANAVMSGASLYAVQRLLGHSSPTMTQRYAHLAPDFMAGELSRLAFPRPAVGGVVDLAEARGRRERPPEQAAGPSTEPTPTGCATTNVS
jgi:integrase